MPVELQTTTGFDPYKIKDHFDGRTFKSQGGIYVWQAELIPADEVELVQATPGSALECPDGRFDEERKENEIYGVRTWGQTNGVAMMCDDCDGDFIGFTFAAKKVRDSGYTPGTHGAVHKGPGCAQHNLWMTGQLREVEVNPYRMTADEVEHFGIDEATFIKAAVKRMGGRHFTLNGIHEEDAVRINPFLHTTEKAPTGDRFRLDHWYLGLLGVEQEKRLEVTRLIVEKARPQAAKIEILYPRGVNFHR
jgi:hypothetical protein